MSVKRQMLIDNTFAQMLAIGRTIQQAVTLVLDVVMFKALLIIAGCCAKTANC